MRTSIADAVDHARAMETVPESGLRTTLAARADIRTRFAAGDLEFDLVRDLETALAALASKELELRAAQQRAEIAEARASELEQGGASLDGAARPASPVTQAQAERWRKSAHGQLAETERSHVRWPFGEPPSPLCALAVDGANLCGDKASIEAGAAAFRAKNAEGELRKLYEAEHARADELSRQLDRLRDPRGEPSFIEQNRWLKARLAQLNPTGHERDGNAVEAWLVASGMPPEVYLDAPALSEAEITREIEAVCATFALEGGQSDHLPVGQRTIGPLTATIAARMLELVLSRRPLVPDQGALARIIGRELRPAPRRDDSHAVDEAARAIRDHLRTCGWVEVSRETLAPLSKLLANIWRYGQRRADQDGINVSIPVKHLEQAEDVLRPLVEGGPSS